MLVSDTPEEGGILGAGGGWGGRGGGPWDGMVRGIGKVEIVGVDVNSLSAMDGHGHSL